MINNNRHCKGTHFLIKMQIKKIMIVHSRHGQSGVSSRRELCICLIYPTLPCGVRSTSSRAKAIEGYASPRQFMEVFIKILLSS